MLSFQNVWRIKRKAVYTGALVLFHVFIHLPVRIESHYNSVVYFLKLHLKF